MLWQIIVASLIVSAVSLISIAVILKDKKPGTHGMKSMVALASGVLLAAVFLELLPEIFATNDLEPRRIFLVILVAIIGFYLIERLVHWHHCHDGTCPPETRIHMAYTNLIGDGIHNFIDGILIGAAFLVSPAIGVATTLAVIAHEVPQEISDAAILLYAGLSKGKVILYNFLFSLTALIGALIAFFFAAKIDNAIPILIAIAAGNFIYLSLADLIPELHHEFKSRIVLKHSLWLVGGVIIFALINSLFT